MQISNESLPHHYLWSNVNFGEAVSEVMTPLTWSLLETWRGQWPSARDLPPFGNIAGRLYLNVSYYAASLALVGKRGPAMLAALKDTLHMPLPAGIEIPLPALSLAEKLAFLFAWGFAQRRWAQVASRLPLFIAANQAWCTRTRAEIQTAHNTQALADLWQKELQPRSLQAYVGVLSSAMRFSDLASPLRQELTVLVGPNDADALLSNLSSPEELLASLGPLAGLSRLGRGEIIPQDYIDNYGHRGPNEWELHTPRPVEHPHWLEAQQAAFQARHVDVDTLLEQQRERFTAALARLEHQHLHRLPSLRRKLAQAARRGRLREAARSELVRVIWMLRLWALRLGRLTHLEDDIFFLAIDEVLAYLSGDSTVLQNLPRRREAYQQQRSLPPYPSLILGSFDPLAWAADPRRTDDVYGFQPAAAGPAPSASPPEDVATIRGSPGSAGRLEGIARVIASLEEGSQLQPGEILVTAFTDIGWTPLFPRAAAIITDVGAALSHAAIVARELGIPAVVGCGDATRRLRTGDRLLVDGGQGLVTILSRAGSD